MDIKTILCCITLSLLVSCKVDQKVEKIVNEKKIEFKLPEWAKNSNIYEVNVRQYTPEGTFNAFAEHLPRLEKMGVDILWFMPVFPISESKRKGTLGSYYAVSDFTEVNPQFGSMDDMKNLISRIHEHGMKIILDWVPNHTGWDHEWIKNHPEYYTQDKDGNVIDPIDPGTGESWGWTDVADLNYDNMEMRKEMIEDLVFWIKEQNIDGYRMDVAHQVPLDFWKTVADTLTKVDPDVFLLAEAEIAEQMNEKAFHACYGWEFHHIINDISKGHKNARHIDTFLTKLHENFKFGNQMHFTSNHDENSWAGTVFERMGESHKVMAVLTATFNGIPLVYSGQEEPLKKRLEFFEKDDIGFKNYEYGEFYRKLLTLKKENKALWNTPYGGDLVKLFDHDHVFAFKRENNEDKVFVILNLSNDKQNVDISHPIKGKDLFGTEEISLSGEIELQPYQYYVIH